MKLAGKAQKLEKKAAILLAGYQAKANKTKQDMMNELEWLDESILKKASLEHLASLEKTAIPHRLGSLETKVKEMVRLEQEHQEKYKELIGN